jgi:SMC interacting uncharacterized protein involved in chromosome segregation
VFITFVLGRSSNKVPVNSNIEELQQEIRRYQQQVQLTEERLRLFEPDSTALASSANEIEACEKFLMGTLARAQDRKVLRAYSVTVARR